MNAIPSLSRQIVARVAFVFTLGLALISTPRATAQAVTFVDPALENVVRDTLQIFSPTPIEQSDMLTLTNLPAAFAGISNLSGLNYATNLQSLDLGFNNVLDASPIAGLTQLTNLHLGWNLIQTCSPLAGLTNLVFLDMNSSQLTNVSPLGSLHKLVQLIVPWNHLTDVSALTGLTNLYYLDIGGNSTTNGASISNVAVVANFKGLQWLSVYDLHVSDLSPIGGLTKLTNLDVGFNTAPANINSLSTLTNLQLFHCTYDTVTNLNFMSGMTHLVNIDCGDNPLTSIAPLVGKPLTSLQVYYDGPLTNAAVVTNFPMLTQLSLSGENLSNISFLSGFTNLNELWIDNNTNILDLSPIVHLPIIWHVDVDNDSCTNFPLLTNLTSTLTDLEINSLANIVNLSFVTNLPNLNNLDVANDQIGAIDLFTNLTQLNDLYLAGNYISDVGPLTNFQYLGYTDLRNNIIDTSGGSVASNILANLTIDFDYLPQNISPYISIWVSPSDDCIAAGDLAYFGASATSSQNSVTYQWQWNGVSIPNATNYYFAIDSANATNDGAYRCVFNDGNGYAASDSALLSVGEANCGLGTVQITQQPINTVAAPGDNPQFNVAATTTLTNLYYQWTFNGTNMADTSLNYNGDMNPQLTLYNVDSTYAGTYQVLVWDDSMNVVASTAVTLQVVDVVPVPDLLLSNQLVSTLGLTPGNPIHLTDLDNIGYLYLYGQNITDISALQYARYMYGLDLGDNPITNADALAGDINLEELYMDSCNLQDANFIVGLTNLVSLSLAYENIHAVPEMDALAPNLQDLNLNYDGPLLYYFRLGALTNLSNLSIHDDGIPDIYFTAGMNNLYQLDVGGDYSGDVNRNFISDISPLVGKSQLNWLSLSWDQVTNVSLVAPFTNMINLYLSSNYFDNINFITNMPNLQQFSINVSLVTNIAPLASHYPLNSLDVSYIQTTNLSYVSSLTNLDVLYAGGNNTRTASFVTALTNLDVLGCESNGFTSLSPLSNLLKVYYLTLEYNQITNLSILSGKTNLQYLYLAGNQIHDISALAGLTNLQFLSLDQNGFTNVSPLASLNQLNWLTLQSNYIQDVTSLKYLTNLSYNLDLSSNLIVDISPLTNLHNLTYLDVYANNLTSLPSLVGLPDLNSLDFNNNQLTNASGVSGMASLTWLGLARNNFTNAPAITSVPVLNTIDLTSNRLTNVSALTSVTTLNYLYMSYNKLRSAASLTGLTSLYYTDLRENWLNTNSPSVMADIATLQSHGTYVDYVPQYSLQLGPPLRSGNQVQFAVASPAGDLVQIWRASALTSWSEIGVFTNTSGTNVFTDTNAVGTRFFYRAQE